MSTGSGGERTTTAAFKPFAFGALEALTRSDVTMGARLRRLAREFANVEHVAAALSDLVGESVTIAPRHHRKLDAPRGTDDAIGVVFAMPGESVIARRILIEVDGALGASVVARALRQKAPRVVDASRAPSPALAGAFAAVLASALRRAHAAAAPRVIAAGPGADLARDLLVSERDVTTAWLSVVVGADAFEARVSVPDALAPAPRESAFTHHDLRCLGDAPIALPLVVATTSAARADIYALERGDAFLPPTLDLAVQDDAFVGPAALVAPAAERGVRVDLAVGGRLVIRGDASIHRWTSEKQETSMPPPTPSEPLATTLTEALEDAPLIVRVELGSVEMKAREWAALAPGDVISLGRRVGDPAILRTGGVEIARGEFVQVDGEYGVRIVTLTRGAP